MSANVPTVSRYPVIDYDLCTGDRACVEACGTDVFDWDDERRVPVVKNPQNCLPECDDCAKACPVEAITFPTQN